MNRDWKKIILNCEFPVKTQRYTKIFNPEDAQAIAESGQEALRKLISSIENSEENEP